MPRHVLSVSPRSYCYYSYLLLLSLQVLAVARAEAEAAAQSSEERLKVLQKAMGEGKHVDADVTPMKRHTESLGAISVRFELLEVSLDELLNLLYLHNTLSQRTDRSSK